MLKWKTTESLVFEDNGTWAQYQFSYKDKSPHPEMDE